ncbi:MAG: efflux RND transporter periplasmic adaptor subunit, partial [Acidobacteriota bacterium]
MKHLANNYRATLLALALGLSFIPALWFWQSAMAHGDEDHGDKAAQPGDLQAPKPRTAERTIQTAEGQFRVRLRQSPADPRDGEDVQFEAAFTERVEGGFGSGDQPIADAKVSARITRADGKTVVAQNLAAHAEEQPGAYGVHYSFQERGDYKVIFAARTADNRQVEADFPVAVTSAPANRLFWLAMAGLLLAAGFAALTAYWTDRRSAISTGLAARRTLPITVGALIFFVIGTMALAYFKPPRERRAAAAMPSGGGEAGEQSATGDPALGGSGAVLTISKESQLLFGIRTEVVGEQQIASGLKVTGTVTAPANAKAQISPPVAGRVTLDSRLRVGSVVARSQQIGTVQQVLGAPDVANLEAQRTALRTQQLQQQANAQQARTRLSAARIELERARNLVEVGAVPKRRLQDAETAYQLAEQEASASEAQAKVAEAAIARVEPTRNYPLLAPVSGVISKLNVTTGQQVEAGADLAELTDLARVWLQAAVFEKDLPTVRGAQRATFNLAGYPGEVFRIGGMSPNRLVSVGTTVDPAT